MPVIPPRTGNHLLVDVSHDKILILTLNKPKALNAMDDNLQADLCKVLDWFEEEPSLWVAIVTANGRFFCAGQDLKGWLVKSSNMKPSTDNNVNDQFFNNKHGFGSISRRFTTKPLILALNGSALGGGAEMVVNADLVVAAEGGVLGFPEVKRGVAAAQGALASLPQFIPYPIAAKLFLIGEPIPYTEAQKWGIINEVVPAAKVLPTALQWAEKLRENCPESVQLSKKSIWATKNGHGMQSVIEGIAKSGTYGNMILSKNHLEGLRAFSEKRSTVWVDPVPPKKDTSNPWNSFPLESDNKPKAKL
ncbi:ClpP/crotonase [Atractiella rhizophila]|nr:ClpP/crotonase [Atractiella rhizophila]